MATISTRETVDPGVLRVPRCPLPRPGDTVIWHEDMLRQRGKLLGSMDDGRPYVHRDDGESARLDSFAAIRIDDPDEPVGAIWRSLSGSLICKPTQQEEEALGRLAEREVPPGVSHRDLAREIWLQGFEIFYTGPEVRDALAGIDPTSVELVTTMPLDRLRRIIIGMYGDGKAHADHVVTGQDAFTPRVDAGGLAQRIGRIRVGGLPGSADPYAVVRPFRFGRPHGSNGIDSPRFIFGADFLRDIAFGDFSCNAVFYEPENHVFIDPSGYGLSDIAGNCLRPVLNKDVRTKAEQAYIGLRVIRHYIRSGVLCDDHLSELIPLIRDITALSHTELVAALDAELFSCITGDQAKAISNIEDFFERYDLQQIWQEKIQPCLAEVQL